MDYCQRYERKGEVYEYLERNSSCYVIGVTVPQILGISRLAWMILGTWMYPADNLDVVVLVVCFDDSRLTRTRCVVTDCQL